MSSLPAKATVSVAASTAAGAALGWAVAFLSGRLTIETRSQVGLLAAVAVLGMALFRVRIPQRDVETPQALLGAGPLVWAAGNGALLGLGVTSRIGFWPWYLLPLGVFLLAQPGLGLLAWGTYGFTRLAVVTLVAARMRAGDAAADRMTTWLLRTRSGIRPVMTAAAIAGAVVVAVAAA